MSNPQALLRGGSALLGPGGHRGVVTVGGEAIKPILSAANRHGQDGHRCGFFEMYLPELGDYLMLNRITAFEQDRLIVWEPTPGDAVASRNADLPVGASQGYSWGFRLQPDGDTTIVTEIFDCTEAAQVIRDAVEDGRRWVPAMHQTLERLAAIVE